MRVAQFTESYLPIINGVSTFISIFKRALTNLGHEPYVFTFGYTRRADPEPNILRSWGFPLGRTGYYIGPTYSRKAWALAQTCDVLHVHHPFVCGALAARLSRRRNKPLIFTSHTRYDLYAQHYVRLMPGRWMRVLLGTWMRRFTRNCDLVIAVSAASRMMLESLGVEAPIEIIPNGVELDRFTQAVPAERVRFDLPSHAFVFVYVGRLGPEKNLRTLLDALALARRSNIDLYLILLGGGPEERMLREHVRALNLNECVRFLGVLPYEQVASLLSLSDAFITASTTESHPLTLIEAMAAGRPVIAFDAPGIHETIVDGVCGLLAQVDAAALAAQMLRLAGDADLYARLQEGARRMAQRYSIENTTRCILAHYQRLIEERKRRGERDD
jgi:glycosyltransferase involved in cell wall biosynthesis